MLANDLARLRALQLDDLEALAESVNDLDLQLTTDGDAPPTSAAAARAFWEPIILTPEPNLRYFGIENAEGAFIGACSLQQIDFRNRRAELSIFLLRQAQRGQGIGLAATRLLLAYAFEAVNLERLYLGVYSFNQAGLRVYERAGFRYEGRLRQMLYYQGQWWDEWQMGLLRTEWRVHQQAPPEGLRPWHPADEPAALDLIARLQPGTEAKATLRGWLQRLESALHSYQVGGKLVGLALPPAEVCVVEPGQQAALEAAIRMSPR
jgi:RimJ/RimL family protein N-acetyltransferase